MTRKKVIKHAYHTNLTFIGPCIVMYFYSKTTQMHQFTLNKSPTRCNSIQSHLFHCKVTVHVSGVTAPIIRSTPDDGCCDTRNMYSDFAV